MSSFVDCCCYGYQGIEEALKLVSSFELSRLLYCVILEFVLGLPKMLLGNSENLQINPTEECCIYLINGMYCDLIQEMNGFRTSITLKVIHNIFL